jgi:hypothetical protein
MKPSMFANFNNGIKFHNYTYQLINNIWSHRFLRQVGYHHIGNENLILSDDVEISS